jgi:hypothetical protein
MPTAPLPAPIDPTRAGAPTDQAGSDTGWASATGTITIRRPEPLDTDSRPGDSAFTEERDADVPSLATP